jgi:hypothetical protein
MLKLKTNQDKNDSGDSSLIHLKRARAPSPESKLF